MDKETRYSRAVRDVVQVLCRVESREWQVVKAECEEGSIRQELLTDLDVTGGPGYCSLLPGEKETESEIRELNNSWIGVVVITAHLLGYVATAPETWEEIMSDWRITNSSHKDVQLPRVNVRELMSDLRSGLVKCRGRLKRIGKSHRGPDEEDIVKQMMLAALPSIKTQIRDKLRIERLKKENITYQIAVRLPMEAEEELGIEAFSFEKGHGAQQKGAHTGKLNGGAPGNQSGGAPRSTGARTEEDKAMYVFARMKGLPRDQVIVDMLGPGGVKK